MEGGRTEITANESSTFAAAVTAVMVVTPAWPLEVWMEVTRISHTINTDRGCRVAWRFKQLLYLGHDCVPLDTRDQWRMGISHFMSTLE